MRISSPDQSAALAGVGYRDAESLFRTKPISEIRNVESNTRRQIEDKKEELRQLIGNRYRDLIESADSILLMKSSCEAISGNIDAISESIYSLSLESNNLDVLELDRIPNRGKIYGIACRVKYLVDTPENIWGCLDEFMFLESAARYVRAKLVNRILLESEGDEGRILSKKFPLLSHQWQLVEGFKAQISQRSRERLLADRSGVGGLAVGAFADALAGVAVVDELRPQEAFGLFLESRKSWIMQRLHSCGSEVVSVLCDVTKIMQVTVGQVGELFLQAVNDRPLFYKMVLDCPPASQLFGGIPSPDEEVRLWNEFRDNFVSVMVILDREFIAKSCSNWLRECGREIVKKVNGRFLLDSIASGAELASAEKQIRETMDSKHVLEGSLEWLRSVFGSEIELPWSRTRELLLEEDLDLWNEIFEDAFVQRMKVIIDSGFEDLNKVVNVSGSLHAVGESADTIHDFHAYLNRTSLDGGVWFVEPNLKKAGLIPGTKPLPDESDDFRSCLDGYFGPEASRIRDAVDNCCQSVLEDLLCFLETPKASLRLKDLVPYLQSNCYRSISTILKDLNNELERLRALLINKKKEMEYVEQAKIVEKSLFIGRLLFAFQEHSEHIPIVLGSPRLWIAEPLASGSEKLTSIFRHSRLSIDYAMPESPGKHGVSGSRTHTSMVASALYGFSDAASPKLEELVKTMRDLCIASHNLWILWLADELSSILSNDLRQDDGLSATISVKGWEEITVKQEQPGEAPELKISLPCMPSLYVTSFLYRACEEIHRVGGHVLDKTILQQLALRLLESVINVYGDVIANHEVEVSEKGALQVLLDIRFAADILSGGDSSLNEVSLKSPATKYAYLRKQEHSSTKSVTRERVDQLHNRFSQKLDPIDWQTYEPYLWENEKQSYLRHAVIFGFFVQLNRLYTDTVQKLPTNSESNLMRCSTVPRFKYLPISAPALSLRNAAKTPLRSSSDDMTSRSSLKAYANGELSQKIDFDENSSFGVATPFLKSFMQVGSKFGESTFKLGSMLADGQVGRLKDRSASAMSTFGDILPMQASGLFSSLTATRSDS